MLPSPRSTVIEIFHPGGFTSDYQVPAKALNIEHYSVWNDTYVSLIPPLLHLPLISPFVTDSYEATVPPNHLALSRTDFTNTISHVMDLPLRHSLRNDCWIRES